MKIIKRLFFLVASLLFIMTSVIGCSSTNNYKKYSYDFFGTFDTVVQVMGYFPSEKEFDESAEYVKERFTELNKLFDIYNDYEGINNIKTINDNAGISEVEVSDEIIDLLELSISLNNEISPKVNIAMGSVLQIWHNYREEGIDNTENAQLPEMTELENAMILTDIRNVVIDKENNTVFLKEEGMSLDIGAVAKGFATQIVCDELVEQGITSMLISSGGNVKVIGSPIDKDRETWGIGIQNPFYFDDSENEEQSLDVALINDTSVVTSGDYQRFYYVDDIKYHHLIDPDTLMPADYFSSVTVMTVDSSKADFLSTALFLTSYEEGRALVDAMDGVEALWIFKDGTIEVTDNMKSTLKYLN